MEHTILRRRIIYGFARFPNVSLEIVVQLTRETKIPFPVLKQCVSELVHDGSLIHQVRSQRLPIVYYVSELTMRDFLLENDISILTNYEKQALERLKASELTNASLQDKTILFLKQSAFYPCTLEIMDYLQIPFGATTAVLASLVQLGEIENVHLLWKLIIK